MSKGLATWYKDFVVYITVVLIPIQVSEIILIPYKMPVSQLASIDSVDSSLPVNSFSCLAVACIQSPATLEQSILLATLKNQDQKML